MFGCDIKQGIGSQIPSGSDGISDENGNYETVKGYNADECSELEDFCSNQEDGDYRDNYYYNPNVYDNTTMNYMCKCTYTLTE